MLSGVHRVQRVPLNNKRRHTSFVTVAILDDAEEDEVSLDQSEVLLETYRGTGPGGQHRNKTETGVRATHLPTGIMAKVDRGRSWYQNRNDALKELERRVNESLRDEAVEERNTERVDQIGSDGRAGHDWSWCSWRDEVKCHHNGRQWRMGRALKGRFLN